MKQASLQIRIAVKMFNLESCSTFANMMTPLIEIGNTFLIGQDIARFRQDPPTIGQDQSIERFVLINRKLNQPVGIELIIQLNSNVTKLQTAFKISNNMEGGPSATPDL